MTSTAVVCIVHGRHEHLVAQHRALGASTRLPEAYVVVAMDDARVQRWSPPGAPAPTVRAVAADPRGLPLAAARNLGARAALEAGAEVLVFLDVDCVPGAGLVDGYTRAVLDDPDRIWSGPVTYLGPPPPTGYDLSSLSAVDDPHPARPAPAPGERLGEEDPDLFWSLSFAVHRTAWLRVGGFFEGYVGYGGEDTDFAYGALAAGLSLGWVGDARAYHQHHPVESPPVRHVDDILRNGRLFRERWGTWPMGGWLEQFRALGLVERSGDDWVRARG